MKCRAIVITSRYDDQTPIASTIHPKLKRCESVPLWNNGVDISCLNFRHLFAKVARFSHFASKVGKRTSKIGRVASKIGKRTSKIGRVASKIGKRTSKISHVASKIGKRTSKVGDVASKIGGFASKVGDPAAKVFGGNCQFDADYAVHGRFPCQFQSLVKYFTSWHGRC